MEFHLFEMFFDVIKSKHNKKNRENVLAYILQEFDLLVIAWLTRLLERNLWLKHHPGGEEYGRSMDLSFVIPEL